MAGPVTPFTIPPTVEDGGATLLTWLRDENPVWRGPCNIRHVFRYAPDMPRVTRAQTATALAGSQPDDAR